MGNGCGMEGDGSEGRESQGEGRMWKGWGMELMGRDGKVLGREVM